MPFQLSPDVRSRQKMTLVIPGHRAAMSPESIRRSDRWTTGLNSLLGCSNSQWAPGLWIVRRETGKEYEVEVLYSEGIASHTGPEPCVCVREGTGEASAGDRIGQPLSRERTLIPGADGVIQSEGNTDGHVNASVWTSRRGRRHWHVRTHLAREPGGPTSGRRVVSTAVRIGKVRSRSR